MQNCAQIEIDVLAPSTHLWPLEQVVKLLVAQLALPFKHAHAQLCCHQQLMTLKQACKSNRKHKTPYVAANRQSTKAEPGSISLTPGNFQRGRALALADMLEQLQGDVGSKKFDALRHRNLAAQPLVIRHLGLVAAAGCLVLQRSHPRGNAPTHQRNLQAGFRCSANFPLPRSLTDRPPYNFNPPASFPAQPCLTMALPMIRTKLAIE